MTGSSSLLILTALTCFGREREREGERRERERRREKIRETTKEK